MFEDQLTRLQEFVQEMKDCHNGNATWTHTEWCGYVEAWTNASTGYVKNGGERPIRVHPL